MKRNPVPHTGVCVSVCHTEAVASNDPQNEGHMALVSEFCQMVLNYWYFKPPMAAWSILLLGVRIIVSFTMNRIFTFAVWQSVGGFLGDFCQRWPIFFLKFIHQKMETRRPLRKGQQRIFNRKCTSLENCDDGTLSEKLGRAEHTGGVVWHVET